MTEHRYKIFNSGLFVVVIAAVFFWVLFSTTEAKAATVLKNPMINGTGTVSTWDTVYFGRYPQSSNGNGGFRTEPIRWRVIKVNGSEVWLLADKKLAAVPFHKVLGAVSFSNSYLRNWLNNAFFNTAFTAAERNAIINTSYGKVHTISRSEVSSASFGFINNASRAADNTDYTVSELKKHAGSVELEGIKRYPKTYGAYWLRETSDSSGITWVVRGTGFGEVQQYGRVTSLITGVRPMIRLNTAAANWTYAGTVDNKGNLSKATQVISVSNSFTKTYGAAPFRLGAKAEGNLSYRSSNTKVAAVSSTGTVTIKNAGTAILTVKAAATSGYNAASKNIKLTVKKAPQNIYAKNQTKTYGAKKFKLKASARTKLSYKSGNSTIAKVSPAGTVSIKNPGKATITITAAESANYKKAVKNVSLNIKLKKPVLKVRALGNRKLRLTWSRVPGAAGYQVYLYDTKRKKYVRKITKKAKNRYAIHGNVKRGKVCKYKVRAYRKVSGKKVYSAYSSVKKGKSR